MEKTIIRRGKEKTDNKWFDIECNLQHKMSSDVSEGLEKLKVREIIVDIHCLVNNINLLIVKKGVTAGIINRTARFNE